jgi:hypothetical protein
LCCFPADSFALSQFFDLASKRSQTGTHCFLAPTIRHLVNKRADGLRGGSAQHSFGSLLSAAGKWGGGGLLFVRQSHH